MRKDSRSIVIILLIALQGLAVLKISSLQRQVGNISNEINHLSNQVSGDISTIYSNVDQILRQEASLIESANTEIGAVDAEELTVAVTYTLTPKEVREETRVSLDFAGELFEMDRRGSTFTATVSHSIFAGGRPKIVIEEKGVKKTRQDDQVGIRGIKEKVFPQMLPRFDGTARYSAGTYSKEGTLWAIIKESPTGINFGKALLLLKVDNELISQRDLSLDELATGLGINEKVPLNDGQTFTMTLVAVDNLGLEHHYLVDHWVAGSQAQREPLHNSPGIIYSAIGELLWKPEF